MFLVWSCSPCSSVVFAQSTEAMPTGAAPTTSEWSTVLLPTKVRLALEVWRYVYKTCFCLLTNEWYRKVHNPIRFNGGMGCRKQRRTQYESTMFTTCAIKVTLLNLHTLIKQRTFSFFFQFPLGLLQGYARNARFDYKYWTGIRGAEYTVI